MTRRRFRQGLERLRDRVREGPSEREFREAYVGVGRQVAEERERWRLSQRQLAELVGTVQSAIARLESGGTAPRLDTLLRVAHALDCELDIRLKRRTRREEM